MNDLFEGYVGIRLWDGQVIDDLLFTLLLTLLLLFALMFRFNYRACLKMLHDVVYIKERQSIFGKSIASENYFRFFMLFQTLYLCSLSVFIFLYKNGSLTFEMTNKAVLSTMGGIFGIILLFYLLKRTMYTLTAMIFSDPSRYKIWKNSYLATMGAWGIFLYIPAIWSTFLEMRPTTSVILFAISYILCRFVILYKTLRIFHKKNTGLFYISLYLCVQEILPLVFLYEGMVYLYNFIKTSTLWH